MDKDIRDFFKRKRDSKDTPIPGQEQKRTRKVSKKIPEIECESRSKIPSNLSKQSKKLSSTKKKAKDVSEEHSREKESHSGLSKKSSSSSTTELKSDSNRKAPATVKPRKKKAEKQTLDSILKNEYNARRVVIPGGGDCLFYCACYARFGQASKVIYFEKENRPRPIHYIMRQAAADWIAIYFEKDKKMEKWKRVRAGLYGEARKWLLIYTYYKDMDLNDATMKLDTLTRADYDSLEGMYPSMPKSFDNVDDYISFIRKEHSWADYDVVTALRNLFKLKFNGLGVNYESNRIRVNKLPEIVDNDPNLPDLSDANFPHYALDIYKDDNVEKDWNVLHSSVDTDGSHFDIWELIQEDKGYEKKIVSDTENAVDILNGDDESDSSDKSDSSDASNSDIEFDFSKDESVESDSSDASNSDIEIDLSKDESDESDSSDASNSDIEFDLSKDESDESDTNDDSDNEVDEETESLSKAVTPSIKKRSSKMNDALKKNVASSKSMKSVKKPGSSEKKKRDFCDADGIDFAINWHKWSLCFLSTYYEKG